MSEPRVYIVVLNWNGSSDTAACVQSALQLDHPNYVVLVCDNDSRPDDLAALRTWGAGLPQGLPEAGPGQWHKLPDLAHRQVMLLHTGANLGFAGGVNVGLRFALLQGDADFAWVLNNDSEVHPGALSALLRRAVQDLRIGLCGSTLVYHGRRNMVQALGGASYEPWRGRSRALGAFSAPEAAPANPAEIEARMDYVVGASMLVSRRFLDTVGVMDDRYFLYSEEHDWAHRGQQQGFALGWAPDSLVFHKHGATIGSSSQGGSPLSLFYLFRAKAMFSGRHYPLRTPVVLCSLALDALKFLVKGSPARALAALRGLLAFPTGARY
ncbi:glycosyltransferase family 2 protein [Aquabacterium sp. OR-4]|uniref:glycosyltransferase family 2 protein n=1 Tax=Aquabacterium sp. OR-4 TaxID=2978127 RepID=UPI0021B1D994|nr:glycosyltransferase family 2 protein [Aquabacterium sp. OR-4]MDT7835864.1 glycosyltransferase family 2 protein [Aquabacterium sp. OR-4]